MTSWYFVCTGNICRSAFGEAYLANELEKLGGEFKVSSGGTGVNQALVPTTEIMTLGARYGLTPYLKAHKPLELKEPDLEDQDIILTATENHRSQVLYLAPHLLHRVFTLREFAYLLEKIELPRPSEGQNWWHLVLERVARIRSVAQAPGVELDIADPFRQSFDVYEKCIQEIIEALEPVLAAEKVRLKDVA